VKFAIKFEIVVALKLSTVQGIWDDKMSNLLPDAMGAKLIVVIDELNSPSNITPWSPVGVTSIALLKSFA
jgi:hypothetical protein